MIKTLANTVESINKSGVKKGFQSIIGMFKGIKEQVSGVIGVEAVGSQVLGTIGQLVSALDPLTPIFQTLSDIFGVFSDIIGAKMAPVMEKLFKILLSPPVIALVEKLGEIFAKFFEALMPLLDILIKILVPVLMPILEWVVRLVDLMASGLKWLADIIAPLIPLIVDGLIVALNVVKEVIKAIINIVIGIINVITGTISFLFGWLGVNIPQIPMLGSGGTVEGSGLAIVHKNEQVLNPAETELYKAMVDRSTTNNSGGNLEITLVNNGNIGVDEIADQLADKVGERLARNGMIYRR
jgi:phage-related protein